MKNRIIRILICFALLSSSSLAAGFGLTNFHSPEEPKLSQEVSLENTSFFTSEVPCQEGDIRVLKINFKNYRSLQTNHKQPQKKIASFYYFHFDQKRVKNSFSKILYLAISYPTPTYIMLRKLIV